MHEELAVIWEDENCVADAEREPDAGISIHALTGSKGTNTIKISGKIKNIPITILINSGSTNNFIAQDLVKQFKIPVSCHKPFNVIVPNGAKLNCTTVSNSMKWCIAEKEFRAI